MPDLVLQNPAPVLQHLVLKAVFHASGIPDDAVLRAHVINFLRILDKTVYEYV